MKPKGATTITLDPSPDVQLLGDTACLRGPAAVDAYRLIAEGVQVVRRRDGIEPSPRLVKTLAALKAAATASASHGGADIADTADVRTRTASASLRTGELVGIQEAARMLEVGDRQARRLAPSVGGVLTRKGWKFDRGLVQAYINSERHNR